MLEAEMYIRQTAEYWLIQKQGQRAENLHTEPLLVLLFIYLLERPEMLPFSDWVTPEASAKMVRDGIWTII